MIAGDSAVISESFSGDGVTYWPFLEDLRTSVDRVYHPACFARERGVEVLVSLVHEHDERDRREISELLDANSRLQERVRRPYSPD